VPKNLISYIVFVFTATIVAINSVSLFFPALLVPLATGLESETSLFEPGFLTLPALVINIILLIFVILYYTKNIPDIIQNTIQFILHFEISRKISFVVIVIILGGYIAFTIQDLSIDEKSEWDDFVRITTVLKNFPFGDGKEDLKHLYVKNFLLYSSQEIFDNIKIIPFIGSIALLMLTYFFTAKIANKRFAGIIAMVILLQSNTFLRYDTAATYSNFWILFYLLSLYVIYNRWYVSPGLYILSIFSKPLSAIFLPMTLFFVYRTDISKRKKIKVSISYVIPATIMAGILLVIFIDKSGSPFSNIDFWTGFTTWHFMLRFDGLVLLFLPTLIVGLFLIHKKGVRIADSIVFLLGGILLAAPLLAAFTGFMIQPYRYIPLIVFFAVGVGVLFSKKNYSTGLNIV